MANFTETEEKVVREFKDDRLKTSLGLIREESENIWGVEAPRIIEDHTDHGIAHSARLINWAMEIIGWSQSKRLTEYELYLLFAGCYLHDIGMQCDIQKYPEILSCAENLGAEFLCEFQAERSSSYSVEEQKEIRKNHHFLSAAWIECAYLHKVSDLSHAIEKVHNNYVNDLMDICKFHSKLPISNCDTYCRYTSERKQFIAAILRFADELDVDANRVNIDTIKYFRLIPENSIFWYLHNQTHISIIGQSVIELSIGLHPNDFKIYGDIVRKIFIDKFQTKNQPILAVLRNNKIPIGFSSGSGVREDRFISELPKEICDILDELEETPNAVSELTDEIISWLQAIRYEVSETKIIDSHRQDIYATLAAGTVRQRVIVSCIGGEVNPNDVEALVNKLSRKWPQCWIISDTRVSQLSYEKARQDEDIQVFTLAEFIEQKVWAQYFEVLRSLIEENDLSKQYVDLACYKVEIDADGKELGKSSFENIDDYIDAWLKDRSEGHITLLGEFGSGKTWFSLHYTYRQLHKYLQDPIKERLPIYLTLGSFTKSMTIQQLVNDALLEQYNLPFVGSAFEIFQEFNRKGKLLIILDGFDEMAQKTDYKKVVNNFNELSKLLDKKSKVILTCRNEYFHFAKDYETVIQRGNFSDATIILHPPRFDIVYLHELDKNRIIKICKNKLGEDDGVNTSEYILGTKDYAEMANKPLILTLLLNFPEEFISRKIENLAEVYAIIINNLLLRNINRGSTFTSEDDKIYFLCELSWSMIKDNLSKIHFTELSDKIKEYFPDQISDEDFESWRWDLYSQTILHRDGEGYFYFSHVSFSEYLVALKLVLDLRNKKWESWDFRRLGHVISMFLRQLLKPEDFDHLTDLVENCETLEEARGQAVHHMRYCKSHEKIIKYLRQRLEIEKSVRARKSILSSLSFLKENTSRETYQILIEKPEFAREYIDYVIDYYSGISRTKRKLLDHLESDTYKYNRVSHLFVLGKIGDESCIEKIQKFLLDDDDYVKKIAADSIGNIKSSIKQTKS